MIDIASSELPPAATARNIAVDQPGGLVFVADSSYLYRFPHTGGTWDSRVALPTGLAVHGLVLWRTRNLSVVRMAGSSPCWVRLRFPRSGGRNYGVALALRASPGLRLGKRWVNLHPDPLFFLTACGGLPVFTTGFSGTFLPAGQKTASFSMPPTLGKVYVSAVAVNPALPQGVDIGNVEVVQLR